MLSRWVKLSRGKWRNEEGVEIVQARWAGSLFYLRYPDGHKEYGDYTTHTSLLEAKSYGQ